MSSAQRRLSPGGVLVRLAIGAATGVLIVVFADPATTFMRPPNSAVPSGALRMSVTVLAIAVLYLVGGITAVKRRQIASGAPSTAAGRPKLRRPPWRAGFAALRWQLLLVAWIFLIAYPDQWTWRTVGLSDRVPIAVCLVVGVVAYLALVVVLTAMMHWAGTAERCADDNIRTMAGIWPRRPWQKRAAAAAFCALNPFTEELLFRGALVYQSSLAIDSVWAPVAVGLAVNVANHWYQGARSMTLHVPFYALAVALLYSPLGLAGAVGFHLAGDVVPVASMKRQLQLFRERHRVQREQINV